MNKFVMALILISLGQHAHANQKIVCANEMGFETLSVTLDEKAQSGQLKISEDFDGIGETSALKIAENAPRFDISKLVPPGTALNFYAISGKNLQLAIPRNLEPSSRLEIFAYNETGVVGIYGRIRCQVK